MTPYGHNNNMQVLRTLLLGLLMLSSPIIFGQGYVDPNRNKTANIYTPTKVFPSKDATNIKHISTTSSNSLVRGSAYKNMKNNRKGLMVSKPNKKQNEIIATNINTKKRAVVIAALSRSEVEKSRTTTKNLPILNYRKFQKRTIAYWRPLKTNIIYQND